MYHVIGQREALKHEAGHVESESSNIIRWWKSHGKGQDCRQRLSVLPIGLRRSDRV